MGHIPVPNGNKCGEASLSRILVEAVVQTSHRISRYTRPTTSLILTVGFMLTWSSVASASEPVSLSVILKPVPDANGGVARLNVEMRLPAPKLAAGEALLRMPVMLVSTPTAAYSAEDIQVRDNQGDLGLQAVDDPATSNGVDRRYLAQRAPVGDLVVRFGTEPRAVSAQTRNGPLFDLRAESGGLMGAGVYFFALPAGDDQEYRISLDWDLSALPKGARGIWSLGEGQRTVTGPASTLSHSYYAVGKVNSEPEAGAEDFALYWLTKPPFDAQELSRETRALYTYMARFFRDEGAPYRIFIRENPYPGAGGTGLAKSFMFAYGSLRTATVDSLRWLLAHEMAHNWPLLTDEDHPQTAWYSEGTAVYYSAILAYRAGLISADALLATVNQEAAAYYGNPHLRLSNTEAGALFWTNAKAQTVPYGRGFMYLVNVNAQVKAASRDQRSVDDLVLDMLERRRRGAPAGLAEWRALVLAELGEGAGRDFDAMTEGKVITPAPEALGPCFRAVSYQFRPYDWGFDEMRLAVVSDLRPGSNAARAGLVNGDEILSSTPYAELKDDEDRMVEMTIRRNGQTYEVRYLPRGEPITGWRWEKVEGVPADRCAL